MISSAATTGLIFPSEANSKSSPKLVSRAEVKMDASHSYNLNALHVAVLSLTVALFCAGATARERAHGWIER